MSHLEQGDLDAEEFELKRREYEMNHHIDEILMRNPHKMPKAVYYIIPNELAERFCFYGVSPLLNTFFMKFLSMGKGAAMVYVHVFKAICYLTPLFGAALSDSLLGKYDTVVYLSLVYLLGTGLLAFFAVPQFVSVAAIMVSLILIGFGTGGIKPCVSAHGGDQFLESQKENMNKFYNYFYMAINIGSLVANAASPAVMGLNCFGNDGDCYAWAFGMCAMVMAVALGVFVLGRSSYRIMPPARVFIPYKICQVLSVSISQWMADGRRKRILSYAEGRFSTPLIQEVRDVTTMFAVLLPAPIFWMAFDQSASTWQNQYWQMNPYYGSVKIPPEVSTMWNAFFIIALVPIFSNFVYPMIESRYGKFRLMDRMIAGMVFSMLSFIVIGLLQLWIDSFPEALIHDKEAHLDVCNLDHPEKCVHGIWQAIPYFIITIGEVLFSISGLNFTYEEVGKRMKASSSSLWLLMVTIGNFLCVALEPVYEQVGSQIFFYINAAIILVATGIYMWIRRNYVYREDRDNTRDTPVTAVYVDKEKN